MLMKFVNRNFYSFLIAYAPRIIAQAIKDNPIIGSRLIEFSDSKIIFPVRELFRKKNPPNKATIANPIITFFVFNKEVFMLLDRFIS